MPRAPDQRVEEARKLYASGAKLIEVSQKLGIPVGTIRSWKNRYKWDNATLQKNKRNVAKKRGGQPGNKNAEGHGGTGPPGNKNAVRTGEFETLFFDTLEPEERTLAEMIRPDKEQLLLREIQLLAVRERRMLKRIQSLCELEAQTGSEEDPVPSGMSVTEYTSSIEKGKLTELRKYEGILGQIQAIEDALTRVQARQQKAIEMLHKFGYDDAKLELATMQLDSPFSRKQKQVLTWWCKESPVHDMDGVIADGAIRSGKTISMSLSFVMWAMSTFTGQNFAMCGKTIGSFRRNVLFWLKLMLRSRGYSITDHRADNLLTIRKDGKENYFYIFGGKDERSQDLIQGITLAGVFFDEVALMPESFVNQATGRCSVKGSKFWFNCNPDGPYHWFKQNWIDKSTGYLGKEETARRMQQAAAEGKDPGLKDILYLHFTMDDNLSLDEEIKARYRSMYVGVFFKRYIMGLWAAAEGIIYDMFDDNKHVQDIRDFYQLLINGNRYVSCDYGTQNATVFLLWNKGTNGKWYCIREYYYSGRDKGKQKTDSEYADDLKEWLDGTKIKAIIVDPSATSFIAELRKRGYKFLKANNDVLDGIRLVGMLLNLQKIVFASSCKETIKEFASYIWDEKALERGEDKPVKQFDHCCDAVRYLCSTIIGRKAARFREIRR